MTYQLKLTKMRAELANLNHCAVPFLSRAAVNLCGTTTIHLLNCNECLYTSHKNRQNESTLCYHRWGGGAIISGCCFAAAIRRCRVYGGSNPIFAHGKRVYGKRRKSIRFPLFSIYFSPDGKRHSFPMGKNGVKPPSI